MREFINSYKSPKLNQEENTNLKSPYSEDIETVIKSLITTKTTKRPGSDRYTHNSARLS